MRDLEGFLSFIAVDFSKFSIKKPKQREMIITSFLRSSEFYN